MKTRLIYALPLLFATACAPNSPDDAGDAGGTGSPYLAKEVVGVHMLSTDTNYDKLSEDLTEEFVRNTFKLGETTEVEVEDTRDGIEYSWGKNHLIVKMGGEKPFASIYTAEASFDRMFQPGAAREAEAMAARTKPPVSGPATQGTGVEGPGIESGKVGVDASVLNDSSQHPTPGITAVAAHLTAPAEDTEKGEAIEGLGDKAIWEPKTETLHVLMNNHILNLTVETADREAIKKERAITLAEVLLANLTGQQPRTVNR
jgi:hypothetical protein